MPKVGIMLLSDRTPRRTFPLITLLIILTNVIVFLIMITLFILKGENFIQNLICDLGYIPALGFSWKRAISSMFMHGGVLHIVFNMWYLWVFGDNVEDRLGKIRYVFLYFLSGLGAVLAHAALYPHSELPLIGASGAISGVMGAYFVLFPRAKLSAMVNLFFIFIRIPWLIPASFFLIFWFVMQLVIGITSLSSEGNADSPGIAFWAHIGGFVVGWVIARLWAIKEENPAVDDQAKEEGPSNQGRK